MTPLFPAQRAAEEFDRALDGRATADVADRYAELLSAASVLREHQQVAPRAEFASALRERLMLAAETELVPAAPARAAVRRTDTDRARTRRRLGTVAASLVIVGGTAGMAAASSGALPGTALYPIKRGAESVSTAVRLGDAAKGHALLGQASTRLDEVSALLGEGAPRSALLSSTLDSFSTSAGAGSDKLFRSYQATGDSEDIAAVRQFTSSGMEQISDLAASADPSTLSGLREAADTISDIDQQASTLCAACGDGGQPLDPPASLTPTSAAASFNALVATPADQATAQIAQAQALASRRAAEAHAARLSTLQKAAQQAAGQAGTSAPLVSGSGEDSSLRDLSSGSGDSSLSTSVKGTSSAVTSLVSGVTGTVSSSTKDTPLSGVTGSVTTLDDTVTKTLDGVTSGSGLLP